MNCAARRRRDRRKYGEYGVEGTERGDEETACEPRSPCLPRLLACLAKCLRLRLVDPPRRARWKYLESDQL